MRSPWLTVAVLKIDGSSTVDDVLGLRAAIAYAAMLAVGATASIFSVCVRTGSALPAASQVRYLTVVESVRVMKGAKAG